MPQACRSAILWANDKSRGETMRNRWGPILALLAALVMIASACGSSSDGASNATGDSTGAAGTEEGAESADSSGLSGSITVLTNRTDLVDTVFVEYRDAFNEAYPDVEVSFEAVTDYEGEVRIRMNTDDYGDVLLIPNSVTADQLPDFFEPLGSVDDLGSTYRFINEQAFEGQVYGIAQTGNATGFVYNKAVWAEAGVTELPTTPDEFLAGLQLIADNTDAVPLYTNYAAGWPLGQWESMRGSISNDSQYLNDMAHTDAPWSPGEDHFTIDSLLFDSVAAGLVEADPTTTDWETSKVDLGAGRIATMALGSWAIVQMEEAAENPDDIGYMPFPTQVDGNFHSTANGDYKVAVNKNSDNVEAARAWLDFFVDESGYAFDQGGIPPRLDGEYAPQLSGFADLGVVFTELAPAPAGEEGLVSNIDTEAEIGAFDPIYRQRMIDAARGQTDETKQDIFDDLNQRWAKARAELGVVDR